MEVEGWIVKIEGYNCYNWNFISCRSPKGQKVKTLDLGSLNMLNRQLTFLTLICKIESTQEEKSLTSYTSKSKSFVTIM